MTLGHQCPRAAAFSFKISDNLTMNGRQLLEEAMDMGVTGGSIIREARGILGVTDSGYQRILKIPGFGKLVGKEAELGALTQDALRMGHYLHARRVGDNPFQAALSVKTHLFDYAGGLTQFEQSWMRRLMPWYSWTRFNLPLQLRALGDHPKRFIQLSKLIKSIEQAAPSARPLDKFEAALMPDFVTELAGLPVRRDKNDNPEVLLLGGWLPAADLQVLLGQGTRLDKLVSSLSPILKTPLELAFNYDAFLGRRVEDFPGQRAHFFNFTIRRKYLHILRNLRVLTEFEKVTVATAGLVGAEFVEERRGQLEPWERFRKAVVPLIFGARIIPIDIRKQARFKKFEEQKLTGQAKRELRRGRLTPEQFQEVTRRF